MGREEKRWSTCAAPTSGAFDDGLSGCDSFDTMLSPGASLSRNLHELTASLSA